MVFSTSSDQAGPLLGGMADIGSSEDLFAIFNVPTSPGIWRNNGWFEGFNPQGCPYDDEDPTTWSCNPAGSFRINVWCAGTGACCNDGAGTCVDRARSGLTRIGRYQRLLLRAGLHGRLTELLCVFVPQRRSRGIVLRRPRFPVPTRRLPRRLGRLFRREG